VLSEKVYLAQNVAPRLIARRNTGWLYRMGSFTRTLSAKSASPAAASNVLSSSESPAPSLPELLPVTSAPSSRDYDHLAQRLGGQS